MLGVMMQDTAHHHDVISMLELLLYLDAQISHHSLPSVVFVQARNENIRTALTRFHASSSALKSSHSSECRDVENATNV